MFHGGYKLTLTILAMFVVTFFAAGQALAQGNGKGGGNGGGGGGGDDPPASVPINYSIHLVPLATPMIPRSINGTGVVVGGNSGRAFVYDSREVFAPAGDPTAQRIFDLNDDSIIFGKLQDLLPGWVFSSAWDVNEDGNVVGALRDLGNTTARKGFVLETFLNSDPNTWNLIVLTDFGTRSYATDINSNGDVLGIYDRPDGTQDYFLYNPWLESGVNAELGLNVSLDGSLNNLGQVAGMLADGNTAFYFDPNSTMDTFTVKNGAIGGLNDVGYVCGRWYDKGKYKAFRFDTWTGTGPEIILQSGNWIGVWAGGHLINLDSDVAINIGTDISLSHTGNQDVAAQLWNLRDLIDPLDPLFDEWANFDRDCPAIGERDSTGFPTLVCRMRLVENGPLWAVILTPFLPSP